MSAPTCVRSSVKKSPRLRLGTTRAWCGWTICCLTWTPYRISITAISRDRVRARRRVRGELLPRATGRLFVLDAMCERASTINSTCSCPRDSDTATRHGRIRIIDAITSPACEGSCAAEVYPTDHNVRSISYVETHNYASLLHSYRSPTITQPFGWASADGLPSSAVRCHSTVGMRAGWASSSCGRTTPGGGSTSGSCPTRSADMISTPRSGFMFPQHFTKARDNMLAISEPEATSLRAILTTVKSASTSVTLSSMLDLLKREVCHAGDSQIALRLLPHEI